MKTGSTNSFEWTTRNIQIGNTAEQIKKEKTKKIIIGSVVGVLAVIVLITIVIIIKKKRKPFIEPFSDQHKLTEDKNTVYFENRVYE